MLSRSTLRRVSGLVLGLLVFAQAALATAGCEWQPRSPAQAIAAMGMERCHDSADELLNPNLCLAHCLSTQQSLDKPSFTVHAMPAIAVLVVPLPENSGHARVTVARIDRFPPGAPPSLILLPVLRQ